MSVTYNTSVVLDGLVLYLDAANPRSYPGTGTAWNDLSGRGNNATLINGITYSNSKNGILTFNGTSGKIAGPVSVSQILNTTPTTTTYTVWFSSAPTANRINFAWTFSDGLIVSASNSLLYFYRGDTYINTSVVLLDSTWKQLTRVDNGSGNTLNFYINGNLVYTTTSNIVYGTATNYLFASYDGSADFFPGSTSVVQLYNRALTPAEIQQNFNALRGRYGV